MAGLRIRWRRESSGLNPPAAATVEGASSRIQLGAFVWPAAVMIVVLALAVRVYNVNWDESTHLHPDERHISIVAEAIEFPDSPAAYFDSASSPFNPYNAREAGSFVYGTFPLFVSKMLAAALGRDTYDELVLVGRSLSALFDAGTVLLVFLIARRILTPQAGLAGAFLYGTAPLAIQHSHFLVVDPFLTFLMAAVLYASIAIAEDGRRSHYALAGLTLGLGMACKVTAVLAAPVLVIAALLHLWPALRAWQAHPGRATSMMAAPVTGLATAFLVAFVAFRVAQPYAFEAPSPGNLGLAPSERWLDDQGFQNRLLAGEISFPPSVQWIDRESYVFPLRQMVTWGMAPGFGLAGWGGLLLAVYRIGRFRDLRLLLPVLFVLVYFGFMGRQFSLYLRYFLPLYPALAVLGGFALVELIRAAPVFARRLRSPFLANAGYAIAALVLVTSLLAGLAYVSIYTRPVTRVEASAWMYANLPDRAQIAGEHWDDQIPLRLPGSPPKSFELFDLPLYDLDTPDKVTRIIEGLDRADYLVLSSNRLVNSIPRNNHNYPVTSRYYDLLLEGELGFRLLREFTSYPGLLGVEVSDHGTEEAWSSYDHPRVLVFEKTPAYSPQLTTSLLGRGPFAGFGLTPAQADRNGLLLSTADLATQRAGGSWTSVFSDSGLAHSQPTLLWLLALELAALAVTPIAVVLFRRLPDRGYLLTKPFGLLVLAYPVWLLVSLKAAPFSQATIGAVLVGLLALGAAASYRSRADLGGFLRQNWRIVVLSEAVFLIAFFVFLELRLENPDLWHPFRGGEKPMDLAFLTAVTRSTTMPPYDPWFAGGYINYYYMGQFLTATLSKLTTIPPEVAFNLAVPTFFALTAAGAFSLSYNLASATRGFLRSAGGFRAPPAWSAYAGGLLGVFFIAVAGNFDGPDQLAERLAAVSMWRIDTPIPLLDALVNSAGGAWQVVFQGAKLADFDYWRSSRMLPPSIAITEFPFFSFLFADLHAHMMAIPFQLLALGLSLALVLNQSGRRTTWREWAIIGLLGLVIGSLRWINSWDYPPFLLAGFAAIAISERRLEGGVLSAIWRFVVKALVLTGLSLVLFKPFLDSYQAPVSGLQASPETTPPLQYLAHFGILVAPIAVWLACMTARALRWALPGARGRAGTAEIAWTISAAFLAIALTCAVLVLLGYPLVAALLPALFAVVFLTLRELRQRRTEGGLRLFVLSIVALALSLSIGVDLVTINGDIVRMNTVFKFYLHAWILFGLAASFTAWHLVFVLWRPVLVHRRDTGEGTDAGTRLTRYSARAGVAGLVALLLGGLVYPAFATPARLDDRFTDLPPTLDGMAYMTAAEYNDPVAPMNLQADYAGIQWLRRNVEGTPAIVEGRTDLYRWGSRFSIYTGLPTVLGWDWHERQQRGELAAMVDERAAAVDAFYSDSGTGQALAFLRRYGVEYVIVGQLERAYYPPEGLDKFQSGLNGALEVAYNKDGLTIYHVRPAGSQLLRALTGLNAFAKVGYVPSA